MATHFTQVPDSWLHREDITVYDCRVMHALMSFCLTEGVHKVSLRQIAAIANISLSILCTTDEDAKKPKEGILDKLHDLRYITLIYAKEIDPITRQPKGQVQTYIRMNYTKLWEDNETFYQTYRPIKLDACLVDEKSFLEIEKRVRHTNTSDRRNNNLKGKTNSPDRQNNASVRQSGSKGTQYVPDTSQDFVDSSIDGTNKLSFDQSEQSIFNWCLEDAEYTPKVDLKNKEYLAALVKRGITTREQYNSLRDFARSKIKGDDKTVYLGNMASLKTLNAWEKENKQQFATDQNIVSIQTLARHICQHYHVKIMRYRGDFIDIYYQSQLDASTFEEIAEDVRSTSETIEQFFELFVSRLNEVV